MRRGVTVSPTSRDRRKLDAIIGERRSTRDAVRRAVVILATAEGLGTFAVMRLSGVSKPVVWRWQERYMREGVVGLAPRKAGRPSTAPELVRRLVNVMGSPPPKETGRWTLRKLEAATGIPQATIHRIRRRQVLPIDRKTRSE